jgi:hypothetical protein
VSSAPCDIRALVADVVATARVGLALQAGTSIEWQDEDAPLPELIQARARIDNANAHALHALPFITRSGSLLPLSAVLAGAFEPPAAEPHRLLRARL